MKGLHWTPCLNPNIIRSWTFSCCTNLSSFQSENSCTFQAHCQFLEGDMSLSKLCQLRSGASRAYSTAVGKEVVIVGCARSHLIRVGYQREPCVHLFRTPMGGFRGSLASFSAPQVWKSLFKDKILNMFVSLELWLYLQPLSGLVAQKKLWTRFIWGLCFRFIKQLWISHTWVKC